MSFIPKYTISPLLLSNIKSIDRLVVELNNRKFSDTVLVNFERFARELSSYASTSIEGNPLPLTEVKSILRNHPENIRNTEKEVLNYNEALKKLDREMAKQQLAFDIQKILEIHADVVDGLLPENQIGRFRTDQVVVNNPRTGEIVYFAPDSREVFDLVQALVSFVVESEGELDPLIIAGIFHKQFVLIHPFPDGNGRTARLVTKVLLAKLGLNTFSLFSFENYYNSNVTNYFENVGEKGNYYDLAESLDFTSWLEYFTGGVLDEILRVKKELEKVGVSKDIRLSKDLEKIISYIQKYGSITDREYSKITQRAKATRVLDFNQLISLEIIERKGNGKNTYYVLKP